MLREARGVLKATVGNRVQPDYRFIQIVFLFFSVSLNQSLVFSGSLCSKASQHILDIVGLSQAEVRRKYLIQFSSHCCSFIKTNLRKINYESLSNT